MVKKSGDVEQGHIGQFRQDERNARRHNPRNIGMIENALNEVGAGRSIVVTSDFTTIAGNGVLEAAANAGFEDALVVHTNGKQLLVHVRDDLKAGDKAATMLGLYDNRAPELSEWDAEILADISAEFEADPTFDHVFSDDDLEDIFGRPRRDDDGSPLELTREKVDDGDGEHVPLSQQLLNANPQLGEYKYSVVVECADEEDQAALIEQLAELGRACKPLIM